MKKITLNVQKDSGIYKRILFDSDVSTTGFTFTASIFDPEIVPRVEMAAPTATLATVGTDEVLTISLDPSLLTVTLATGEVQKVLAWECLLDPGQGWDI